MPGELLPAAAEREVAEETGMIVKAKKLVFVIEGAQCEPHHRVDLVFQCEYPGETGTAKHPDSHQIGTQWLPIDTLNKTPLFHPGSGVRSWSCLPEKLHRCIWAMKMPETRRSWIDRGSAS